MSAEALAWAFNQNAGTPIDRLILLHLADFADEFGVARVGQSTIADRCGCSLDTVQRAMKRLAAAAFVERTQCRTANGFKISNTYRLSCPLSRKLRLPRQHTDNLYPKPHLGAARAAVAAMVRPTRNARAPLKGAQSHEEKAAMPSAANQNLKTTGATTTTFEPPTNPKRQTRGGQKILVGGRFSIMLARLSTADALREIASMRDEFDDAIGDRDEAITIAIEAYASAASAGERGDIRTELGMVRSWRPIRSPTLYMRRMIARLTGQRSAEAVEVPRDVCDQIASALDAMDEKSASGPLAKFAETTGTKI